MAASTEHRPTKPELSLRHLAGCPAERIERYTLPTPAGGEASVTRCIDCGAHAVAGGVVEPVEPEPADEAA